MGEKIRQDDDISFKQLFIPLTVYKAVSFIFVIGFAVFSNSLFNSFVIDDVGQIVMNSTIHSLDRIPDLFFRPMESAWVHFYYRPLPLVFSAFIYALFGENVFFYHLCQVLVHLGSTILVFLIFKRYLKIGLSFILSIVFLVHPINQEAVVYISALQDALYLFFGLVSFYLISKGSLNLKVLITSGFFLFLSLISKETGFLFLIVNLVYLFLFKKKWVTKYVFITILTGLIYAFLRVVSKVPLQKDSLIPLMELSFWERMINVPAIVFYYISTFFYPDSLVSLQSWYIERISFETFYLPLFLVSLFFSGFLAIYFLILMSGKHKEIVTLFVLWFVLGLALHIQIIPIDATVANRFFYFPIIGLLAVIGFSVSTFRFNKRLRWTGVILAITVLSVFSVRTIIRNTEWKDQFTLMSADIKHAKSDTLIEHLYGKELTRLGRFDEAEGHLTKSVGIYPNGWLAWNSLGINYYSKGDFKKAEYAYRKTIELKDNFAGAYENMGLLLLQQDDHSKTRSFIKDALVKHPASSKLWNYLIFAEYRLNNYEDAVKAARRYHELRQDRVSRELHQRVLQKKPIEGND